MTQASVEVYFNRNILENQLYFIRKSRSYRAAAAGELHHYSRW